MPEFTSKGGGRHDVDYSPHAVALRSCGNRQDGAPTAADEWGNAAATFRAAARNLDEAGRREYSAYVTEAVNDNSLPPGFRDELRRQHAARPSVHDAGPEPFVNLQCINPWPIKREENS